MKFCSVLCVSFPLPQQLGVVNKGGNKSKLTTGKPRTPTATSASSLTVASGSGVTASQAKVTATVSEEIIGSGSSIASSATEDKPAATDATARDKDALNASTIPGSAAAEGSAARTLPAMVSSDRLSLHSFLGGQGNESTEQKDKAPQASSDVDAAGSSSGKTGVVEGQAGRDSEAEASEGMGDPSLDSGDKLQASERLAGDINSGGAAVAQAGDEREAQAGDSLIGGAEVTSAGSASSMGAAAVAAPAAAAVQANGFGAGEENGVTGEKAGQREDSSSVSVAAGAEAAAAPLAAPAPAAESSASSVADDSERGKSVKEGGGSDNVAEGGVQMTNGDVAGRGEGSGEGKRGEGEKQGATKSVGERQGDARAEGIKPAAVERELDEVSAGSTLRFRSSAL